MNQEEYNKYFLEWSKVVNKELERMQITIDLLDSRIQRIMEYIKR